MANKTNHRLFKKDHRCSTCRRKHSVQWWEFSHDCADCRNQWKAWKRGDTPISPLARAIEAEEIKRTLKTHKPATQI